MLLRTKDVNLDVPIPMTVPYSGCVSALVGTGQKQMIAKNARKRRENEDNKVFDCVLEVRLGTAMVEGGERIGVRRGRSDPFYEGAPY